MSNERDRMAHRSAATLKMKFA